MVSPLYDGAGAAVCPPARRRQKRRKQKMTAQRLQPAMLLVALVAGWQFKDARTAHQGLLRVSACPGAPLKRLLRF